MSALQSSGLLLLSPSPHRTSRTKTTCNAFQIPKNLRNIGSLTDELGLAGGFINTNFRLFPETDDQSPSSSSSSLAVAKLYAIFEAVSDRVEMHNNIGKQREEWNSLLLTSINAITLTATTITGIAAASGAVGPALLALKLSAAVMFSDAAAMLAVINRIQPAQLVEEQRTPVRLFQQLHNEIQTVLSIGGGPTERHVDNALARVVALDRAYPLPLLGVMLEKFPAELQPSVWWPEERRKTRETDSSTESNGWDSRLEEEMRSVAEVLRTRDGQEYKKLGEKALKLSKICAISGPCLTAMAAVGAALVGTSPLAAIVGVVGGALACIINTVEHGGQIGMVFEMYRNNAGFFKFMEESIESNLMDAKRRENGELFEMKVALNLGRSISELRTLAGKGSSDEFGSKLF